MKRCIEHGCLERTIGRAARCSKHQALRTAELQAYERKRTGERLVRVAQVAAAMAARLATLRDDEIEAERFEALRFRDASCAATNEDVFFLQLPQIFPRKIGQVHCKNTRCNFLDRGKLRVKVRRVGCVHGLGRGQTQFLVVARDRVESAALSMTNAAASGARFAPATWA